MGKTIIAARNQVDVPLSVLVTRDGGIAGLTVVARIFDGDDLSSFLDFDDGVFKDAGHVTPTLTLPAIQATEAPGVYGVDGGFDLSAITVPTDASSLLVRYEITAGGETGDSTDTIVFARDAIASPVWDRELKGNTHNIPTSAGRRLRELSGGSGIADGIAQAGAAQSITLEAGETSDDDFFKFMIIALVEFTGVGQIRIVTAYDGTTKIATVDRPWDVVPDATSSYLIGRYQASILSADTEDVVRDAILNDATRFAGADIAAILADTDELDSVKITTARANNLDEITAARLAELDPANIPGDVDTLLARLTALRAANLDEITAARLAELDPGNMPADIDAIAAGMVLALARLDGELVDVATFLGVVLGTPAVHTPTTITAGAYTFSVGVVGSTVTITRLT